MLKTQDETNIGAWVRNGHRNFNQLHGLTQPAIAKESIRCVVELGGNRDECHPIRIVDKKGFIKVQCSDAQAVKAGEYQETVKDLWEKLAVFKTDTVLRPDYFVCVGPRVCGYSAVDLERVLLLMDLDIGDREPDEEIIVVGSINDVR